MKITKARLKQIIKEELLKEQVSEENIEKEIKGQLLDKMSRGPIDTSTLIDQVAAYFKEDSSKKLYGYVTEEDIEGVLQDPLFNKYYDEADNYHASDEIKKAYILKHIKENPGTSLKDALPELDGDELAGFIDRLSKEGKIEKREDGYAIKQDLKEYQDPSLSDKQKQVDDLIMRDGGLIDLIEEMGNSAPSMLDTYRMLIKAIVASGIRAQALI